MKKIMITAGHSTTQIDAIRGITNFATGTLGSLIVANLVKTNDIDQIFLLTSEHKLFNYWSLHPRVKCFLIKTFEELSLITENLLRKEKIDIIIPTMAIEDFKIQQVTTKSELIQWMTDHRSELTDDWKANELLFNQWLKKGKYQELYTQKMNSKSDQVLFLSKNKKLIKSFYRWSPHSKIIGFKLVTTKPNIVVDLAWARQLMHDFHYSLLVLNNSFEINDLEHRAWIIDNQKAVLATTKNEIANLLTKWVIGH